MLRNYLRAFVNRYRKNKRERLDLKKWLNSDRATPPPHKFKQEVISFYRNKYGPKILVETGTFLGDMVYAQRNKFKKIYSIELDPTLYRDAKKKFEGFKNITILQGDSGKVLRDLMPKIDEPAIFWLDGHYSAGNTAKGDKSSPILEELEIILNSKKLHHVILIDDARLFVGKDDYPTIDELKTVFQKRGITSELAVEGDSIRIVL